MNTPKQSLILLFHPHFSRSKANLAMANAARALPGVRVVDMYAHCPDGVLDVDEQVAWLLAADRVVLQFPVQWYSSPALLKAWQDAVLTRMYYMAYDSEGKRLEGTPMELAVTAGNVASAYSAEGVNLFTLSDLLRPFESTAHRCGLPWRAPFVVYQANKLSEEALAQLGQDYAAHLKLYEAEPVQASETAAV